jgi:hypothetical protein
VSKKDYFGLFAFFNQTPVNGGGGDPQTAPVLDMATAEQTEKLAALEKSFAAAAAELKAEDDGLGEALEKNPKMAEILKTAADKRSRQQFEELTKGFEKDAPAYASVAKKCRDLADQRSAARKGVTRVMVMEDMAKPRTTHVLDTGLYDKRLEEISAGVPARLPPLPADAPRNRLALASWPVSPGHPLTARVTVNRFWQMLFGIGLTKTSEDFGRQGEYPVHRELLDWLAADFRDHGWDVKRILRLVVTSATYRQSSRTTPELLAADPANRLLARGPRYRMPSFMIRDQALAAGGLLVERPGGPPVNPVPPPGSGRRRRPATSGTSRITARRSRRSPTSSGGGSSAAMFFDTQSRSTCVVKPTRTNTPLRRFATLNDPTYVEARARGLPSVVAGKDDAARPDLAVRLVLGRRPSPKERKIFSPG